jgi:hypothetical protein
VLPAKKLAQSPAGVAAVLDETLFQPAARAEGETRQRLPGGPRQLLPGPVFPGAAAPDGVGVDPRVTRPQREPRGQVVAEAGSQDVLLVARRVVIEPYLAFQPVAHPRWCVRRAGRPAADGRGSQPQLAVCLELCTGADAGGAQEQDQERPALDAG